MAVYEVTLELPQIGEELEDRVVEATDGVIAIHYGVTTVTIDAEGPDYLAALRSTVRAITRTGVVPLRLVPDLVSRSEIAERAGVTRQAVGHWVSGSRQAGAFPTPYVLAGGGMWLWSDVAPVLSQLGISLDEELSYPTRAQIALGVAFVAGSANVGDALAFGRSNWLYTTAGASVVPVSVSAPESASFDFGLAA